MSAPLEPIPETASKPAPIPAGDFDPRPLLRRSKFVTTLIGQVGILAAIGLAFAFMRDAETIRDGLLYFATLTSGGQIAQGFVDHAKARARA